MKRTDEIALAVMKSNNATCQYSYIVSIIEDYTQEVRQAVLDEMHARATEEIVTANRRAILDEIYNPENRLTSLSRDGGESQWKH